MKNTIEIRKSGRPIEKDTAAYQRRRAMRSAFPTLIELDRLPHEFVEFVRTNTGALARRFYVKKRSTNRYFCYIPTPLERSLITLPAENAALQLHSTNNLKTVAVGGKEVIQVGDFLKHTAADVGYNMDFNIALLTLT